MDRSVNYNRWLPYWAVLQADMQQTLVSWVYRVWLLVSVLAGAGYLLYRVGLVQQAGIVQPASALVSDLLRWTVLGSISLVVVLTVGCISSERGTMADSVLSRAISRYQYFLGKWHSRLLTVLATYLVTALAVVIGSAFLLHEDLTPGGCAMALGTVAAMLAVVVTCGVTVSAMCNSSVLGVAILWVALYGGGFALSFLPPRLLSPQKALDYLPHILQGRYDLELLLQLMGGSVVFSCLVASVGMFYFARRDV
jgi:hypothetical protein